MFSFVLGTRPEVIKLAPLLRRMQASSIPFQLIHTNQHYDVSMDAIFFAELKLLPPTHQLHSAAATPIAMIANVMTGCEKIWKQQRPSVVIVQGDTNSVFGAAFAANKNGIPVAHVEAGLRSDDLSMPEEVNRILTDHIASRLYAPTSHQIQRLRQEGISDASILLTGNTIADAVSEHVALAKEKNLPPSLEQITSPLAIITLHRPALVDDKALLENVLGQIEAALAALSLQAVFLVHPRTRIILDAFHFSSERIFLHEPIGYFPMLKLLSSTACVLTDSGGLQEEAALLQVPCVTLRSTTERPETLDAGGNILVPPLETQKIARSIESFMKMPKKWKPLYSVEHPSDSILSDLRSHYL